MESKEIDEDEKFKEIHKSLLTFSRMWNSLRFYVSKSFLSEVVW